MVSKNTTETQTSWQAFSRKARELNFAQKLLIVGLPLFTLSSVLLSQEAKVVAKQTQAVRQQIKQHDTPFFLYAKSVMDAHVKTHPNDCNKTIAKETNGLLFDEPVHPYSLREVRFIQNSPECQGLVSTTDINTTIALADRELNAQAIEVSALDQESQLEHSPVHTTGYVAATLGSSVLAILSCGGAFAYGGYELLRKRSPYSVEDMHELHKRSVQNFNDTISDRL